MKINKIKYWGIILLLTGFFQLSAQENKQEVVVPLSKPGANGSLKVGLISGSIKVEGYSGKEVIIKAISSMREDEYRVRPYRNDENDDVEGLKKISGNSLDLEIEEKDNLVTISTNQFNATTDLEIKVPLNFSLNLRTVNNGKILVNHVRGDHEISNVNGDVEMFGISGSTVVSAVNGKIEITFDEVSPNKPMAFASMNKKIDITLPANTKATLKMNSKMGEVYTDFDVDLVKNEPEIKQSSENSGFKVVVNKYLTAKLNGGGPEYNFKNFNGNIIIRKKK
jgi:hypothetical protein